MREKYFETLGRDKGRLDFHNLFPEEERNLL
jgi:hypothetical protein